jgi:hypothetical protein
MKKTLFFGFCLLAMAACTPKLSDLISEMPTAPAPDTVFYLRTVTDSILLAGEEVTVQDTFPCPPGLNRDSLIYRTRTVQLPGRRIEVQIPVHDTLIKLRDCPPVIPASFFSADYGWSYRLPWLLVALLCTAYGITFYNLKRKKA